MSKASRIIQIRGNLSREHFAAKIAISARTVQRWELENELPKGNQLARIAKEFGVNIHWLVTGQGQPYINRDREGRIEGPGKEGLDREHPWEETGNREAEGGHSGVSLDADLAAGKKWIVQEETIGSFTQAEAALKEIYDSRHAILIKAVERNLRELQLCLRKDQQIRHQAHEIHKLKEQSYAQDKRINALEKILNANDSNP